ncbi:DUF1501 domain-containing protein [Aquihabitans sp. G128]|uniref:DUF1501 domain-containing protein n=1 Tax=Aquihabitans sp. G128 TaxID=2849779 RepID=UPI001C21F365|nr:DUF1501 domain-containing protein [Aquihabitans sp. G128]QXC63313.1 DUF1501 domain-containing protein [Aquihabitans sp. G128]
MLQLGGGNDGLNTVVPIGNSTYLARRGGLAIRNALPITSTVGLHPSLPKLKARYAAGKVGIVQGIGQATTSDLSHFSSTASWMAGTAGTSRTSGWLGRWLDGVPEATDGLRAVTLGSSIPLHLAGQQAMVTAVETDGDLFGSDRSEPWMGPVYDAVAGFGAASSGRGAWADRLGTMGAQSVELAGRLNPIFTPELPDDSLASQLTVVARLINANLGIRVFNASLGSFDTHENEAYRHALLLGDLDAAIDAFYATLSPAWAKRVAIITFSEFGRRIEANGSNGTDHGTASVSLVIGDNVKGGLFGQAPDLAKPDARGNPVVHVDHRSLYASVLGPWLGGDASGVLGASYPDLGLFKAGPGSAPVVPVVPQRPLVTGKGTTSVRGVRGTATARATPARR